MEVHLLDARVPVLQKLGMPFSLLGRPDPTLGLPFADIDFDQSIRQIVDHLTGLGHRRIGFVNQSRETFDSGYGPAVRALEAFEHWTTRAGCRGKATFSPSTPRDGWQACQTLLADPEAPTALVVMNDRALPGVLQALAARGLRVPEDVSVVSAVTSATASEMMVPALTSADAPSQELARMAVAHLISTIETGRGPAENVLIPCRLTPRASTGPCPSSL
jgi:DNA-binding LacI/PurR family transcriptional regulator